MAEIFQLKHSGEQIDALLDKAETAVQPIPDGDGNTYLMADGLVTSEDTHYYFPDNAPANDPAHTFAMASEMQATDAKLTELSVGKVDYADDDMAVADGLVDHDDIHFYLPTTAPNNEDAHTIAMRSEVAEVAANLEKEAESVAERFADVDTELDRLNRGEAYVFGETLAFRNYADAKVQGNTLTL